MKGTKNNASVFSTSPSMFPSSRAEGSIYGASCPPIGTRLGCSEPCVDDETRTSVQFEGLGRQVDVVNGVKEGRGRKLRGLLSGTRPSEALRGHRIHGHSTVRHGNGFQVVMSGVDNHGEGRDAVPESFMSSSKGLAVM